MASDNDEFLNKQAILDLTDKMTELVASIKEAIIADESPADVVTDTGAVQHCCRLIFDHYGNLIREVSEDRKFPFGFTRG